MNWFAAAFVGAMGVAVVGVDYASQTRKTGAGLGTLSVGAYSQTITGRFSSAKADAAEGKRRKAAQSVLAKTHLPAAPQGWTRRAMQESDRDRLFPAARDMEGFEVELMDELDANPMTKALLAADKSRVSQREQDTIWVYENSDALVLMSAQWRPTPKAKSGIAGMQSAALNLVAHNMGAMSSQKGFAWIRGVPFYVTSGALNKTTPNYRVVSGQIGEQITIKVRADASDDTIRAFIAGINYDALNGMLDTPLTHIGNDVAQVAVPNQLKLASFMAQVQQRADRAKSAALQNDLQNRADNVAGLLGGAGLDTRLEGRVENSVANIQVQAPQQPTVPLAETTAATKFQTTKTAKNDLPRRLTMSGTNGCGAGRFCSANK